MNTKTGVQIKTDRKTTDHEYRLPPDYMTRKEHDENLPQGFSGSWNDLTERPFWEEIGNIILKEGEYSVESDRNLQYVSFNGLDLSAGDAVTVIFDNIEYECVVSDSDMGPIIGNYNFYHNIYESTNEPFLFMLWQGVAYAETAGTHTFTIIGEGMIVKTLSEEYIPLTVPRTPTAEVGQVVRVKAVDADGVPTEWEAADINGIVNFTSDGETITADKTFAEITALIENGITVTGYLGTVFMPLREYKADGYIRFLAVMFTDTSVTQMVIGMSPSDEIAKQEVTYIYKE